MINATSFAEFLFSARDQHIKVVRQSDFDSVLNLKDGEIMSNVVLLKQYTTNIVLLL